MCAFFSGSNLKESWENIQLDNFPSHVDEKTFHKMLDSLVQEVNQLELSTADYEADLLKNQAMQLVGVVDPKRESIIDECMAMVKRDQQKEWEHTKATAAANAAKAGHCETFKFPSSSERGVFLKGYLGQRGKIFKRITWSYFVLTSKHLLCFESEEHYFSGSAHTSLIALNTHKTNVNQPPSHSFCPAVLTASGNTSQNSQASSSTQPESCVSLTVDGSERTLVCFSPNEATLWRNAISSRLSFFRFNVTQHQPQPQSQQQQQNQPSVRRGSSGGVVKHVMVKQTQTKKINTAFSSPLSTTTAIDLSGVVLDSGENMNCVVSLLCSLPNLRSLNLDNCSIPDHVLDKSDLIGFLSGVGHIAHLSLRCNYITQKGAVILGRIFHPQSSICELHVDGNTELAGGVQSLLLSLPHQTNAPLTKFTAATTQMGLLGVSALCRMKEAQDSTISATNRDHKPSFDFIDVSDNPIGDEGLEVLASHVEKLGVQGVCVEGCGGSARGVNALVSACGAIPTLHSLRVCNNVAWDSHTQTAIASLLKDHHMLHEASTAEKFLGQGHVTAAKIALTSS